MTSNFHSFRRKTYKIKDRNLSFDSKSSIFESFQESFDQTNTLKSYYYDQEGKISFNPLPYKLITTHPDEPLKYRNPGSKPVMKIIKPTTSFFNTQTTFDTSFSKDVQLLDQSIWSKEIFVMKDGTIVNEGQQLPGFRYKIQNDIKNKVQKQIDLNLFFNKCNQEIKSKRKLKFLFTTHGKLLRSLDEIPRDSKVVLVSDKTEFIGLIEAPSNSIKKSFESINLNPNPTYKSIKRLSLCETDLSDIDKSVGDLVESRFISLDKGFSSCHRKKGTIAFDTSSEDKKEAINSLRKRSWKIMLKPIKSKKKPKAKLAKHEILNELKVKMGEAVLKIDKEFPKLSTDISELTKKFSFSEGFLHKLYAQYKTLILLSVSDENNFNIKKGLKRSIFVDNYKKGSEQGGLLLGRIFDSIDTDGDGFINWEEFIKAMSIISYGTHEQQIDLFFQIYDEDHSGGLSYEEIIRLCKLQMHFAIQDEIIDYLAENFAKNLFEIAGIPRDKNITPKELKEILLVQKDRNLVEMFCSFNLI